MSKGRVLVGESEGNYLIKMSGDVRVTLCASLNRYVESIFTNSDAKTVLVDLLDAEGLDSTTLGLLAKLGMSSKRYYDIVPLLFCENEDILKIFEMMSLDEFFTIIRKDLPETALGKNAVQELPCCDGAPEDEDEARRSVLEAHRLLVEINPKCEPDFVDLIRYLEEEVSKHP